MSTTVNYIEWNATDVVYCREALQKRNKTEPKVNNEKTKKKQQNKTKQNENEKSTHSVLRLQVNGIVFFVVFVFLDSFLYILQERINFSPANLNG